jgi:hypothetical protein
MVFIAGTLRNRVLATRSTELPTSPNSSLTNPYAYGGKAFGTAIGTLFLAGFGCVWMALALQSFGELHALQLTLIAIVAGFLTGSSLYTFRHTHQLAKHSSNDAWRRRSNRAMGMINAAQWTAISLSVVLLTHYHQQALVLPAIILIVGIHFLPLALLFRSSPNGMTGVSLIAWAVLYPLLLPASLADSVGAMVTGLVLLSCAVAHAWVATHMTRELSVGAANDNHERHGLQQPRWTNG